jgi:hypothetical protein
MKQLLAFLIIVLLVTTPSCKWLRKKGYIGKKAASEAALKLKLDSIRVADSVRKAQDRLLALEIARQDSINKADQARKEWESKYRYNIIIGSFITPEYARSYSAEFSAKGYKTKILKLEGTNFEMVSAEAHQRFSVAVERLKQFQDTVAYDAWLYILK